jgi:hypothetical protein
MLRCGVSDRPGVGWLPKADQLMYRHSGREHFCFNAAGDRRRHQVSQSCLPAGYNESPRMIDSAILSRFTDSTTFLSPQEGRTRLLRIKLGDAQTTPPREGDHRVLADHAERCHLAISRGQPSQACAVAPERLGSKIRRGGSRLTCARLSGEGDRQQHNSALSLRHFQRGETQGGIIANRGV